MSIFSRHKKQQKLSTAELTLLVETADAANAAANADVHSAQSNFLERGDQDSHAALEAAREAAAKTARAAADARDLLKAQKDREDAEAKATAQARVSALDEQLGYANVLSAAEPLDAREVALMRQLAELRAARLELADQFAALSAERFSLLIAAGHDPRQLGSNEFQRRTLLMTQSRIVESLRADLGEHAVGTHARKALTSIVEGLGGNPQPLAPVRAIGGAP